jgi:hypothetical protein
MDKIYIDKQLININKQLINIDKIYKKTSDFWIDKIYKKYDSYNPPVINISDNLIYSKAEPWAKQNIESFLSSVLTWISICPGDKLPCVLSQFYALHSGVLSMDCLQLQNDKDRLGWIENKLNEIARSMNIKAPEELFTKAAALFWSI